MQIPDLFKVLADYLGFAADFLSFRGMERYRMSESVDPTLAAYFVAGVLIAYLFATARRFPGYQPLAEARQAALPPSSSDDSLKSYGADMTRFIILSAVGTVVAHWFLCVAAWVVGGAPMGGINATMNAALATNAVYHPIAAVLTRLRMELERAAEKRKLRPRSAAIVSLTLLVVPCLLLSYWIYALASVHGLGLGRTSAIFSLSFVGLLVVLGAGAACLLRLDDDADDNADESQATS
jgi:hypothetical protein